MTDQSATTLADPGVSASRAGLITTGLTLINVVLGFLFQSIVASRLGLSQTSDDFQLAWSIVTYGTLVFFTLVPILLVPRIEDPKTRAISLGDWPKLLVLGLVMSVAQVVYAQTCEDSLANILTWSAPSHLLAAMTGLPQAVAYVRRRFIAAGMGPAVNGAALLATFLAMGQDASPMGLGLALSAGYFAQFIAVAFFSLPKGGRYTWSSQVSLKIFLFLVAFTLLSKFQPLLERVLSLAAPVGATATLGFGQKIAQGLLLFAAFGLALTANATLARFVKGGQLHSAAELLAKTIVATALFTAFVVLAALPFERLVINILFVRGEFSSADGVAVSDVLLCQVPWVIACALTGALTSYLYIEQSYKRVAVASVVGLSVTAGASTMLRSALPLTAVPIASSLGAVLTFVWVAFLVSRTAIWPVLKVSMRNYRRLLTVVGATLILACLIAYVGRLFLSDYQFFVNLVLIAVLTALMIYVRCSRLLWRQCRAVVGGRI